MSRAVDEARLETDIVYRFNWLAEFIGLTERDLRIIRAARPLVTPLIPELTERIRARMFAWEATRRHFLRDGQVDPAIVGAHLGGYIERLLALAGDDRMGPYLDRVGAVHRRTAGDPDIEVPLVQMDALLGFIADQMIEVIAEMELPEARTIDAIRAFSKLLWIQNDLIRRRYLPVK